MKDVALAAKEGFLDAFVLAWAIVVSVIGGVWRVSTRLLSAFMDHRPLPVAPGKTFRLP